MMKRMKSGSAISRPAVTRARPNTTAARNRWGQSHVTYSRTCCRRLPFGKKACRSAAAIPRGVTAMGGGSAPGPGSDRSSRPCV